MTGPTLFGKLPAHGDFVSRGLGAPERRRIDDWLSGSLALARATYDETFDDRFDRAVPWRCAGTGLAGAIAPSQDASGRRFPVIVLTGGPADAAHCEELLYAAIGERWSADRLVAEAGTAPVGPADRWWLDDITIVDAYPQDLLTVMLAERMTA